MSGVNTFVRGAGAQAAAQAAAQAGAAAAAAPQGLDALQQTNQTHAQLILMDLRDHLRNKTGVLRLLHTSRNDKEMKFKTAGSLRDVRAGQYQAGVTLLKAENFEPDSVEDLARTCVLKSIDYELDRVNRGDLGFERYDANADNHLLNEISRHPALNGV